MLGVRIEKFMGEMPRVEPRLLNPIAAQTAENCNLNTGSLISFFDIDADTTLNKDGTGTISSSGTTVTGSGTSFDTELTAGEYIFADSQYKKIDSIANATSLTTTVAFSPALSADTFAYGAIDYKTIFKLNSTFWLAFEDVVEVCRAHVYNPDDRFYYTDGIRPKQSDYDLASNSGAETFGEPQDSHYLGVPQPTNDPIATIEGTAGMDVEKTTSYVYTLIGEFGSTLREGPPSSPSSTIDVYENQYVELTNFDAPLTANYNLVGYRIYRLETGTGGISNYELLDDLLSSGKDYYDFDDLYPDGTGTMSSTGTAVTGSGTAFDTEQAVGDFIFADDEFREIDAIADATHLTLVLAFTSDLSSDSFKYGGRLYDKVAASQSGGSGTLTSDGLEVTGSGSSLLSEVSAGDYIVSDSQVREVVSITDDTSLTVDYAFSPDLSADAFTYGTANTLYPDTAEILPSDEYDEPPSGLSGLISLSNGCYAAFAYNKGYISEPLLPDAWPSSYEFITEDTIVALGCYGTTIIAGTDSYPYRISGYDPNSITKQMIRQKQACLFKRGMVSGDRFVVYPSPDGLYYIGEDGERILTEGLFTKELWRDLLSTDTSSPATTYDKEIIAFLYDNKYFAFFEGTADGFIIDFSNATLQHYIDINLGSGNNVYGGHVDPLTDKLYLLLLVGVNYIIYEWDGKSTRLPYIWKSKVHRLSVDVSYAYAAINGDFTSGVTVKLYADSALIHTESTIKTNDPFAIAVAYGKEWEVQIEGDEEVYEFIMAPSMEELKVLLT